jgi:uncharacterized protein (DUF488 family)
MRKKPIIFTIGHSTHTTREFMQILESFDIEILVDVRHYPGSRHVPQFGKARLRQSLKRHGIDYTHIVELGGRRRVDKDSHLNDGWRSAQFRGYADYMQTEEFDHALKELMKIARRSRTVIMCAEAVPWRCHRSMIGDALIAHGFKVEDIFSEDKMKLHHLTSFAKVKGDTVTYPGPVHSTQTQ